MPSTRTLAFDLGLSRGTVVEVYSQLVAEGYLIARQGSGTEVAVGARPLALARTGSARPGPRARWDFRPSLPDLSLFPRPAWRRALTWALDNMADEALGYGDPRGVESLRTELAQYLRRVRNVHADPEHIVICSGVTQALTLICRVLSDHPDVAVEDPGSPALCARISTAGLLPVSIPVDAEGLRVDLLRSSPAKAALVTPAHQFPTGVVLSARRRADLLRWAAEGGLVIEDDYDAEFRYDHRPTEALQSASPDRVLYAGSASKALAPALRLGWLVLPAHLVDSIADAKQTDDLGSPAVEQYAFTHLLATGAYDRHLRHARTIYQSKRDALMKAIQRHLPIADIHGISAGLQTMISLPSAVDEHQLVKTARRVGVGIYPLGDYGSGSRRIGPGLVLGFASLGPSEIASGIECLGQCITQLLSVDHERR
ncbi:PLP-dependent aminotransferase family protein [Fodinicola feengrottensis]|uniref:PLP-dependent aminotransferase family protein n=1 Tax=Fodinicola feengrottensis TaxID=435914 RepID=A0ABN2HKR4_9ACTN